MSWLYLILAILFEVIGTTFMKLSNGFSSIPYSLGMFGAYVVCFTFLAFSLKTIEVSIAYAVWSGVGVVLISSIGVLYFGDSINAVKVVSTALIIAGVIGLNLSGAH